MYLIIKYLKNATNKNIRTFYRKDRIRTYETTRVTDLQSAALDHSATFYLTTIFMKTRRLELPRDYAHQILNLTCLPFHHVFLLTMRLELIPYKRNRF